MNIAKELERIAVYCDAASKRAEISATEIGEIRDEVRKLARQLTNAPAQTPREVLDGIDSYMADSTVALDYRRALWDILVGLRGADRKHDRKLYRHDISAGIRAHALPRMALSLEGGEVAKRRHGGFRPNMDLEANLHEMLAKLAGDEHYEVHARRAIQHLLQWWSPLVPDRVTDTYRRPIASPAPSASDRPGE